MAHNHCISSFNSSQIMVFVWYEVTRPDVKNLGSCLGGMQVHFSVSQGHSMHFQKQLRGLIRIRELE